MIRRGCGEVEKMLCNFIQPPLNPLLMEGGDFKNLALKNPAKFEFICKYYNIY
jgi:hypothetical protein